MISKEKVIIIGGGLSGLTLAYLLQKKGVNFILLEAAIRVAEKIIRHYLNHSTTG